MKQSELIILLKYLDSVTSSNWNIVRDLVSGIDRGEIVVLHYQRLDYKKDYMDSYPLLLSNIDEWSTQESGVNLRFKYSDGSLLCDVEISDVSFDGYRKDPRWSARLILKDSFVKNISVTIIRKFNIAASYRYDEYLDEVKKLWIENYTQSILNPS